MVYGRIPGQIARDEQARLGTSAPYLVLKSKQLALLTPVDWDLEREVHQLLGGELRWVLAVDDGGDDVGRQQGKT